MKVFSKFLAVLLALVTVLTLIPFSVFAKASDPWLEVEGDEGVDAPVVTVKVDAAALMAWLNDRNASDTVIEQLQSAVEFDLASLREVFSVVELFELIPREEWLSVVPLQDIIEEVGAEQLLTYINLDLLATQINKDAVLALLEQIEDLSKVVDFPTAFNSIDKSLLLKYMDKEALSANVALWDAVELLLEDEAFDSEKLASTVKVSALVADGRLAWNAMIDLDLLSNAAISSVVANYVTVADELDIDGLIALVGENNVVNYLDESGDFLVAKLVEDIGVQAMIDSGFATVDVDGIMSDSAIDAYALLNWENALAQAKAALASLSAQELESYVIGEEVLDLIALEDVVELVGGYDNAIDYVDVEALLADPDLDLAVLLDAVQFGALVAEVGAGAIFSVVPATVLMAHVSVEEIYEILMSINLRPYTPSLLVLILRKVLSNVDELVIDGQVVATEDDKQMLQVDSAALVNVFNKLRPTLTDIANAEDGKLLSTYVSIKYTVDGTEEQKTKDMILEFVLDGDVTREQAVAEKLSNFLERYITYSYKNGTLTADITLPAGFARFLGRILDSNNLDAAAKQGILNLANMDGESLVGVLETLTPSNVVNMIKAIDLDKAMNLAVQYAYVQRCIEIASKYSGVDMSGMDIEALLDASAKLPGIKTICNAIKSSYGVDVYAALEKYETSEELYEAALNKAEASVNAFERVTNLIIRWIETYVPETAMNLSLMDGYNGNGNFTLNKNLNFNTKNVAIKALKRLIKLSGLNMGTEAVELLLNQVTEGATTLKLDLSLQLTDVYSITYKDKATDETLFTAFLPVGADLSVFQSQDATGGVAITDWVDENGDAISTMPARDVVVYTGRQEVSVTFVNKNGEVLGTVKAPSGDTLANYLETIDGFEALVEVGTGNAQYLYKSYQVVWKYYNAETGEIGSRWMPSRTVVTEDITVIADVAPDYYLKIEDVDYDVYFEAVGTKDMFFTLKIHEELPESFVLNMDYTYLLQLANMSYNVQFDVLVGEQQFKFFSMDDALLASLRKAAKTSVTFHFGTTSANAEKSVYAKDENASFYTFEIQTDGVAYNGNFVSDLYITLPYEQALVGAADAAGATRVHLLYADGSRELVDCTVENGFVTIKAPHFSEYVVSNEYKVNLNFVSTEASDPTAIFGAWKGEVATDNYFPADCELKAIPVVSAENVNNYTWVSTSYKVGEQTGSLAYGEIFVVPAAEVDVTVTVKPRECSVLYYVLGEQLYKDTYFFYQTVSMRALDDPAVMAKDPDGTPSTYKWIGFDASLIGACDMYVHAKWNDATYYVEFIGRNGSAISKQAFDEATFYTVVAPAVPTEAGYVGAWSAYDLKSAFGKADGYTLQVKAVYTEASFKIFADGIVTVVGSAKFGETVTVTAPDKAGYDKIIIVTLVNNTTQTVEEGVFVMPESDVYVDVTYVPHTYSYTINGWTYEGQMNDTVTFEILIPRGKVLTTLTKGCTLADAQLTENGALLLTYSFELLEDGMSVDWNYGESKYNLLQILNGKIFDGNGVPVSTNDDAVFLGWSPVFADNMQFAIFGIHEESASWLWLWILIVLLVLIGIIVLFYLLYKAGKVGANAFVRVILWIANLFFTVCIAIAELGLKIAGLFKKSSDAK